MAEREGPSSVILLDFWQEIKGNNYMMFHQQRVHARVEASLLSQVPEGIRIRSP
jgi:hypothetical protein